MFASTVNPQSAFQFGTGYGPGYGGPGFGGCYGSFAQQPIHDYGYGAYGYGYGQAGMGFTPGRYETGYGRENLFGFGGGIPGGYLPQQFINNPTMNTVPLTGGPAAIDPWGINHLQANRFAGVNGGSCFGACPTPAYAHDAWWLGQPRSVGLFGEPLPGLRVPNRFGIRNLSPVQYETGAWMPAWPLAQEFAGTQWPMTPAFAGSPFSMINEVRAYGWPWFSAPVSSAGRVHPTGQFAGENIPHGTPTGAVSNVAGANGSRTPAINVWEDEVNLIIEAEVPGVSLDDIDLQVAGRTLQLRTGRLISHQQQSAQRPVHIERAPSGFFRMIPLSCEIDCDKVEARLINGVLRLTLPKLHVRQGADSQQRRTIRVSQMAGT